MKKFFQIIGFITLMAFSFFYTEKTVNVVKDADEIMIEIKENMDKYKKEPIDATIVNNTIIPGISGMEVNINDTYDAMKKVGKYEANLIKYKKIYPTISIHDNYDKYIISGNQNKKEVTFIFKVDDDDNINKIVNILNENGISSNFFIDGKWFENNTNLIIQLMNQGNVIGNMSYNLDYSNNNFIWMDTIITKMGKQKTSFCYTESENEITLKNCSLERNYTIMPNIIVKNNPLIEIKKQLVQGSIIAFDITNKVEEELPIIIKYIKSRDYQIVNLTALLTE